MSQDIDFTKWTDAQLCIALRFDHDDKIQAEINRRRAAGTPDDGSEARVNALLASSRKCKIRER